MASNDFRFRFSLRVRWSEVDAQGVVFNGRYLDYLEVAQAEYYRHLGVTLYDEEGRRYFDTAAVRVELDFVAPARVDELLDVYTRVVKIGSSSITTATEIHRSGSEDLVARAQVVYVDYDSEAGVARRVPGDVRTLIEHYEETGEVLPIEQFPNLARP